MATLHIFLTSVDILKDAFSREIFQRNLKVDISFGKHSNRVGLVFTWVRPVRITWTFPLKSRNDFDFRLQVLLFSSTENVCITRQKRQRLCVFSSCDLELCPLPPSPCVHGIQQTPPLQSLTVRLEKIRSQLSQTSFCRSAAC